MLNTSTDNLAPTAVACLVELLERYTVLRPLQAQLLRATTLLCDAVASEGTVLVCGNGGSAADCEHMVGELLKGFKLARPLPVVERARLGAFGDRGEYLARKLQQGIRAVSLTSHLAFLSAVGNDNGGDLGFAQALWALARRGDVFMGLSTSGNSRNVVLAAVAAKARQLPVIGMTGSSGGELGEHCDVLLAVPESDTARIQELHLPIYHALCAAIEQQRFGMAAVAPI